MKRSSKRSSKEEEEKNIDRFFYSQQQQAACSFLLSVFHKQVLFNSNATRPEETSTAKC